MAEVLKVVIKNADGTTADCPLCVSIGSNIADLKKQISEEYAGRPTEDRMKLVFSGRCAAEREQVVVANVFIFGLIFFIMKLAP